MSIVVRHRNDTSKHKHTHLGNKVEATARKANEESLENSRESKLGEELGQVLALLAIFSSRPITSPLLL